jgi:hydroxypyruvate reductase
MNFQHHLIDIFKAGLETVNPYVMIQNHLILQEPYLYISAQNIKEKIDLTEFDKIFVLGAGKASAKMAKGIEDILQSRITKGLIAVKYGHSVDLSSIKIIEAGHPTPDENSVKAAESIIKLAQEADDKTLILNVISGGGSSLLCSPVKGINFKDKLETTKVLLSCGATIQEINCIRKHLSSIKGGRLLQSMVPAKSVNFILSDVVGDSLDTIASGITAPDNTTFSDAYLIIKKYAIENDIPNAVYQYVIDGQKNNTLETIKRGDPSINFTSNLIIGSNSIALQSSKNKSESLGFSTFALTSTAVGEARELGCSLFALSKTIRDNGIARLKPICILIGGESTVTLKGKGLGGRNQEMALSFLKEMEFDDQSGQKIHFLAASTDGSDGLTDAAGAFASSELLDISKNLSLSIDSFLSNNDSWNYFNLVDGLYKTGPTMTNVCDIQIIIIDI